MTRTLLFALLLSGPTFAAPPQISIYGDVLHDRCNLGNGAIQVFVSGGTPPYSYSWSNGSTEASLSGLTAGTYMLTVVDAVSAEAEQTFTVQAMGLREDVCANDGHANCPGICYGEFRVIENQLGGTPPYTYGLPVDGLDMAGYPYFHVPEGACGGEIYYMTATDANGCSGNIANAIVEPQMNAGPMVITNTTGSCTGAYNGTVTLGNVYDGMFWDGPQLQVFHSNGDPVNTATVEWLNGGSYLLGGLDAGAYYLTRTWFSYTAYECLEPFYFSVPDLGTACGTVSGKLFIDNDANCAQDPTEPSVPQSVLEFYPGPIYALTDMTGNYEVALANDIYTIAPTDPTLTPICPATSPYSFIMATAPQVIDLADGSTVPLDLRGTVAAGHARPGFTWSVTGQVRNTTPQVSGPITAVMTFPPEVTFVNATPAPTTVTATTLSWDLSALTAYTLHDLDVQFNVPASTPLGTTLLVTLNASNTLPEGDLGNNTAQAQEEVMGSFDPNDKTVRTSSGTYPGQYIIGEDQWLDYTIRFQNTGTAEAIDVVVTDTLAMGLDMSTFEQGVGSHPFTVSFKPGRVVEWRFAHILLPDSGTNEVASHGLVQFRIQPKAPLLAGTVMANNADIFFDLNAPIRTNDAVVTLETSTSIAASEMEGWSIYPNPAERMLNVQSERVLQALMVIAMDGRTVSEAIVNSTTAQLDLFGLPAGVYVLKARCTDGALLQWRFVRR